MEVSRASEEARAHPSAAAWNRLGDAFMQKARESADFSYYGHAEAVYRKSLDLDSKYVPALVGMAWVTSGRHEFEKSVDWANKALALSPDRPEIFGLLGDADVEMGDYDSAFEHFQKMMDLRPDISSYSRSAHLLFLTGNSKKASYLMLKAIAAGGPYPENVAWCRAQIGLMEFAAGSYLSAGQGLAAALQKTPDNFHVLAAMGKVKAAMKDYPSAVEYYKKAEAITPQYDFVASLGDLYTSLGKTAEAKTQYDLLTTIEKINKANGVTGDMQAILFAVDHDGDPAEALRLAEAEYKTRKNVYAADTLAWCYLKNNRFPEARKYIDQALRYHTPEALFLFHKGVICAKLGDFASARSALYQALSLNPNFHPIYAPEAVEMVRKLGDLTSKE